MYKTLKEYVTNNKISRQDVIDVVEQFGGFEELSTADSGCDGFGATFLLEDPEYDYSVFFTFDGKVIEEYSYEDNKTTTEFNLGSLQDIIYFECLMSDGESCLVELDGKLYPLSISPFVTNEKGEMISFVQKDENHLVIVGALASNDKFTEYLSVEQLRNEVINTL